MSWLLVCEHLYIDLSVKPASCYYISQNVTKQMLNNLRVASMKRSSYPVTHDKLVGPEVYLFQIQLQNLKVVCLKIKHIYPEWLGVETSGPWKLFTHQSLCLSFWFTPKSHKLGATFDKKYSSVENLSLRFFYTKKQALWDFHLLVLLF